MTGIKSANFKNNYNKDNRMPKQDNAEDVVDTKKDYGCQIIIFVWYRTNSNTYILIS